ncbi:hypothetical protein FUSO7_03925 [Fusobacterium necrophorum BFTR-2]|nr:7-cyano-7-deazaguanine synthase [Fusobacterium necrophorum]KDE74249.1 hypothetical protein FUSO7_03925 [Fusobacterium necrophorum BFTR-2]
MIRNKKICKVCLKPLPTDKQGNLLNNSNICHECLRKKNIIDKVDWSSKKKEFEDIINSIRNKHSFDVLVMLSGGKDSVYVAYLLSKIYNLKVIGITIDNGFEYASTFENSSRIASRLGISHFIYRLPISHMKEYYKVLIADKNLRMDDGSQLCFFCGRMLKSLSVDIAKKMDVGIVASGHTLEQVRALGNEKGSDRSFEIRMRYIQNYERNNYLKLEKILKEKNLEYLNYLVRDNLDNNRFDNFIYPLSYFEYKPLEIVELLKKELNWEPDVNFTQKYISSGCKLAKLMEYIANKNGVETYVEKEFSDQIRRGSMTKEEVQEIKNGQIKDKEIISELISSLELSIDAL